MSATNETQERTTVSVYTDAHSKALDAVHALRKKTPPIKTSVTAFASDAIRKAAEAVLSPKSKSSKA